MKIKDTTSAGLSVNSCQTHFKNSLNKDLSEQLINKIRFPNVQKTVAFVILDERTLWREFDEMKRSLKRRTNVSLHTYKKLWVFKHATHTHDSYKHKWNSATTWDLYRNKRNSVVWANRVCAKHVLCVTPWTSNSETVFETLFASFYDCLQSTPCMPRLIFDVTL